MVNRHLETGVKVEVELEITIMTIQEVEVETDIITGLFSQGNVPYLVEEMTLDPDPISRVSTNHDCVQYYRCREYDHFASECPNILNDEEPDNDNADPASYTNNNSRLLSH